MGALRSLLSNVNGPTGSARKLYYGVWESVMLYAASVWAKAVERNKNRNARKRAQRAALVRSFTAYRTVSTQNCVCLRTSCPFTTRLRSGPRNIDSKKNIYRRYPFKRRSGLGLFCKDQDSEGAYGGQMDEEAGGRRQHVQEA